MRCLSISLDMTHRDLSQWPDLNLLTSTPSLPYCRQERVTYSGGDVCTALIVIEISSTLVNIFSEIQVGARLLVAHDFYAIDGTTSDWHPWEG